MSQRFDVERKPAMAGRLRSLELRRAAILPALLAVALWSGCASEAKRSPNAGPNPTAARPIASPATESAKAEAARAAKAKPKRFPKWNPIWWFGNADDLEPPEWYRLNGRWRRCAWHWRNPLHNFTHYVIGIADKPFERAGRFPTDVFNPNGGWNWAICRYKCLRLPFISHTRGRFAFYAGWRQRGNFGVKLVFWQRPLHTQSAVRAKEPCDTGEP